MKPDPLTLEELTLRLAQLNVDLKIWHPRGLGKSWCVRMTRPDGYAVVETASPRMDLALLAALHVLEQKEALDAGDETHENA